MIKKLALENFQGFADYLEVRLAPLTLIFGPNSSGKSSLIRSLLMFQQSAEGFAPGHQSFVMRGNSIDLASFSNVINRHEIERLLAVGISAPAILPSFMRVNPSRNDTQGIPSHLQRIDEVFYKVSASQAEITSIEFEISFGPVVPNGPAFWQPKPGTVGMKMSRNENGSLWIEEFIGWEILDDWYLESIKNSEAGLASNTIGTEERQIPVMIPSKQDWESVLSSARLRGLFLTVGNPAARNDESYARGPAEAIELLFRIIRGSISRSLEGVTHVKPLRDIPERLLIVDDSDTDGRPSVLHSRRRRQPSHDVVSEWITKLTKGQYELRTVEFESQEVGFLGRLRARHLFDTKTQTQVSFRDVGVGLSQVLPIIEALEVAQMGAGRDAISSMKTVLIEQPELHLHPRMQADLMDLMISVAGDSTRGVQILAETHSENMVLRLQKRIREGKVRREDVAIIYADRDLEGNNTLTPLAMEDSGDFIEPWPLSFADVRVQDLF
jgi:predicted ATPase